MAGSGSTQAAVGATFLFGIVVIAATVVIFLSVRGRAATFFRNELGLGLTFFLVTSALWGLLGFIATLVNNNAPGGCQAVIAFGGAFDQLARIALEQFILWGIHGGIKLPKPALVLQGALGVRFVFGAIFVGVQRPQFSPKCVASNLVFPIGIIIIVIDALVVLALSTRIYLVGKNGQGAMAESTRSRALLFIGVGLGIWTGMSVPLLLGLKSTSLVARTVVPSLGLLILLGIVAFYAPKVVASATSITRLHRKALSMDSTDHLELQSNSIRNRDINLQDSESAHASPPQVPAKNSPRDAPGTLPIISQPPNGQAVRGVGGVPVEGKLFPPMRAHAGSTTKQATRKYMPRSASKKKGKITISSPVVNQNVGGNALNRIPTIDLATAATQEKERRNMVPQSLFSQGNPSRLNHVPRAMAPEEMISKLQVSKRKQVPINAALGVQTTQSTASDQNGAATTSAVQLSPANDGPRRRSPRQPPQFVDDLSNSASAVPPTGRTTRSKPSHLHISTAMLSPPPRSPKRPPPISPLRITRAKHASVETFSLLDPRTPPAIPSKYLEIPDGKLSRKGGSHVSTAMLSPLVPRVKPSSIISVDRNSMQIPTAPLLLRNPEPASHQKPSRKGVEKKSQQQSQQREEPQSALLLRRRSLKNSVQQSRRIPASLPLENSTSMKMPGQKHTPVGLPRNPRTREDMMLTAQSNMSSEQPVMFMNNASSHADAIEDQDETTKAGVSLLPRESILDRPRPIKRRVSATVLRQLPPKSYLPESSKQLSPIPSPASPASVRSSSRNSSAAPSPTSPGKRRTTRNSLVPELPALPAEYVGKQSKIRQIDSEGLLNAFTAVPNEQEYRVATPQKNNYRSHLVSKFSIDTALSPDEPQSAYSRMSIHTRSSFEGTIGRSSLVRFGSDPNPATNQSPSWSAYGTEPELLSTPKATPSRDEDYEYDDETELARTTSVEVVTVQMMLDTSTPHNVAASPKAVADEEEIRQIPHLPTWHHRVGEELPGFLSRRSSKKSRKLSPPRPLALERSNAAVMIVEAEPSPLDSPQEVIDKIQEQLKQFGVANGDSRTTISEQQRMSILANLESEMGLQETQWQRMRQNLAQDSPSTIASSTVASTRTSLNLGLDTFVGTGLDIDADGANPAHSISNQMARGNSDEITDDSLRRPLSTPSRMSYLSVPSRAIHLASLTPPDTDESDGGNFSDNAPEADSPIKETSSGFAPIPHSPIPENDTKFVEYEAEQKPPESKANASRLSFSTYAEQQSPLRIRPLTQRPPRRSKRISLLPDIVENPQPISSKRDTLGIYQFPWGEKSDSATPQPSFFDMSTRRQWMNPSLGWGPSGQPNSFFETDSEYGGYIGSDEDDDDINDNFDDDFDETTLWEIASLLKTKKERAHDGDVMPIRQDSWDKLDSVAEDDNDKTRSGGETSQRESSYDFIPVTLGPEVFPAINAKVPTTLWVATAKNAESTEARQLGLPHPKEHVWRSYIPPTSNTIRPMPRFQEPATIASFSLWMPNLNKSPLDASTEGLWSLKVMPQLNEHHNMSKEERVIAPKSPTLRVGTLWTPSSSSKARSTTLPQPDSKSWESSIPPVGAMVRSRTQISEPPRIISQRLWSSPSKNTSHITGMLWSSKRSSVSASLETTARAEALSTSWMDPQGTRSIPHRPEASAPTQLMFTSDWLNPSVAAPSSPGEASESSYYEEDDDEYSVEDDSAGTAPGVHPRTMPPPVFMTDDQWNSAFQQPTRSVPPPKRNTVDQAAWATEDEWAATLSNAASTVPPAAAEAPTQNMSMGAALNTLAKLSSSHAMKDHPFFDPSVMALVSDYLPSNGTTIAANGNEANNKAEKSVPAEPTKTNSTSTSTSNDKPATPVEPLAVGDEAASSNKTTKSDSSAEPSPSTQPATNVGSFWSRLFSSPGSSRSPSPQ